MKLLRPLSIIVVISMLILSCESPPNKERMQLEIGQLEAEVTHLYVESGRSDLTMARSAALLEMYLNYANSWPADSLTAEYLFQAAMIDAEIHEDVQTGIRYLERIVDEFPDHPVTARTLFLVGFTYAEYLNDFAKAREAYQLYLERYPDGEMAESVEIELSHLEVRPDVGEITDSNDPLIPDQP